MSSKHYLLAAAPAILVAMGCAKGASGDDDTSNPPDASGSTIDAPPSCGDTCDTDHDGVPDADDQCPATPSGEPVNQVGCSDSQLTPTLEDTFPPYGLTWTPTGDLGRAGGLTWTYTGIDRADLFHIYWIVCDDPATPCGISLDGPLDVAAEHWQFSVSGSDLLAGRMVFNNSTHIVLADTSTPALAGRLTVTIVDASNTAISFASAVTLGVTARDGEYGAEIPGTGFAVNALAEVQDPATLAWTPYLDYYDAAATPDPGPGTATSFAGSFYDK